LRPAARGRANRVRRGHDRGREPRRTPTRRARRGSPPRRRCGGAGGGATASGAGARTGAKRPERVARKPEGASVTALRQDGDFQLKMA
jgi:hypothetical protein